MIGINIINPAPCVIVKYNNVNGLGILSIEEKWTGSDDIRFDGIKNANKIHMLRIEKINKLLYCFVSIIFSEKLNDILLINRYAKGNKRVKNKIAKENDFILNALSGALCLIKNTYITNIITEVNIKK